MAPRNGSAEDPAAPITIKKYANRRLYNTVTSSYVTLDDLAKMVRDGVDFAVFDAKTGEDITRAVLTQIIVEEEGKGQNLLPIGFLRQLISLYGDSLQGLVPQYLDMTMQAFARNQEQMRQYLAEAFGGMFPFGRFDEMSRQNIAMFEQAMRMLSPFQAGAPRPRRAEAPEPEAKPKAASGAEEALEEMRAQLKAMQSRLDRLSGKPEKSEET